MKKKLKDLKTTGKKMIRHTCDSVLVITDAEGNYSYADSVNTAAEQLGVAASSIYAQLSGRLPTVRGLTFEWKDMKDFIKETEK